MCCIERLESRQFLSASTSPAVDPSSAEAITEPAYVTDADLLRPFRPVYRFVKKGVLKARDVRDNVLPTWW
jgi:hypothetical protein